MMPNDPLVFFRSLVVVEEGPVNQKSFKQIKGACLINYYSLKGPITRELINPKACKEDEKNVASGIRKREKEKKPITIHQRIM